MNAIDHQTLKSALDVVMELGRKDPGYAALNAWHEAGRGLASLLKIVAEPYDVPREQRDGSRVLRAEGIERGIDVKGKVRKA